MADPNRTGYLSCGLRWLESGTAHEGLRGIGQQGLESHIVRTVLVLAMLKASLVRMQGSLSKSPLPPLPFFLPSLDNRCGYQGFRATFLKPSEHAAAEKLQTNADGPALSFPSCNLPPVLSSCGSGCSHGLVRYSAIPRCLAARGNFDLTASSLAHFGL